MLEQTEKYPQALGDIIACIRKPLLFASKNDFAGLGHVKGLQELIPAMAYRAMALVQEKSEREILFDIKSAFEAYDAQGPEQKKLIILKALFGIDRFSTPAADGSNSRQPAAQLCHDFQLLQTPVQSVKGIGPKLAEILARMNLHTVEDLLYLLPRSYIDRRTIVPIQRLEPGMSATVIGKVFRAGQASFAGRRKTLEILVSGDGRTLSVKWFNLSARYVNILKTKFSPGKKVILSGKVSSFRFNLEMHHPEIDLLEDDSEISARLMIIPVYPLSEGLNQKTLQRIIKQLLATYLPRMPDYLPEEFRNMYHLPPLKDSFRSVHCPGNQENLQQLNGFSSSWHRRIVFDEFFLLQAVLALRKRGVSLEAGLSCRLPEKQLETFIAGLPFTLTNAQQKALEDIRTDMQSPAPMNRLLQGDVGSGKTVVALLAAMISVWNGFQAAIMAPTEILAEQHYETVCRLAEPAGVSVTLLKSSQPKSHRDKILDDISSGAAQIVIGTHALIQGGVRFHKLGFATIDEQHKFGVLQRSEIKKKGANPDVLVMTATPIPRTLGLTVYGDLDVSVIDELPPGRKPVITKVFHEKHRERVYGTARDEIRNGNQVFIVYPLVEESEKMDLLDATRMSAHLQDDIFPEYRIGLVHGRMSADDKDQIMRDFQSGHIQILVATTVIEVGIDVPNASLMIVEHAERFGLSQLHQLRGRVGRGRAESKCILLAQYKQSDDARRRLEVMQQTGDGFKIAEADFDIRGPGEFLGTRQAGLPDFRVAHIGRDFQILAEARKAAFQLIDSDPELKTEENRLLREVLLSRWKGRLELAGIG